MRRHFLPRCCTAQVHNSCQADEAADIIKSTTAVGALTRTVGESAETEPVRVTTQRPVIATSTSHAAVRVSRCASHCEPDHAYKPPHHHGWQAHSVGYEPVEATVLSSASVLLCFTTGNTLASLRTLHAPPVVLRRARTLTSVPAVAQANRTASSRRLPKAHSPVRRYPSLQVTSQANQRII